MKPKDPGGDDHDTEHPEQRGSLKVWRERRSHVGPAKNWLLNTRVKSRGATKHRVNRGMAKISVADSERVANGMDRMSASYQKPEKVTTGLN